MIHILIIVIYFEYHTSFIVILLLLAFYLLKTLYFHITFYIENQQSFGILLLIWSFTSNYFHSAIYFEKPNILIYYSTLKTVQF